MNRKVTVFDKHSFLMLAVALTVIALAAFLSRPGQAQTTGQQPDGAVSVTAASVSSRISYQGVLKEGGTPVTGNRNFTFRFYTAAGCATPAGSPIVLNGVAVANGLFSVKLDVDQALFDGKGLWLGVDVGGAGNVTCEEITPVPYALSLRPGTVIVGSIAESSVISVTNTYSPTLETATAPNGVGEKKARGVDVHSVSGPGVRGSSWYDYGGIFKSSNDGKAGLYAEGPIAAEFKGDVTIVGEVYAQSLHVRNASGQLLGGIDASGQFSVSKSATGDTAARTLRFETAIWDMVYGNTGRLDQYGITMRGPTQQAVINLNADSGSIYGQSLRIAG